MDLTSVVPNYGKRQQNVINLNNFCLFTLFAMNVPKHSQLCEVGEVAMWQKFLSNNWKRAVKNVIWGRKTENFVKF